MGSSFQYNVDRAFKVIDAMQQNIIRNAQGLLQPGYNKQVLHFGQTPGSTTQDALVANNSYGSKDSVYGGGDTLDISGTSISFEQGTIEPAFSPTSLAIRGEGFFVLAENLRPGAKLYLSRAGDFHYDTEGNLVNPNGLYVVGGNGNIRDPIIPIKNPGDGTVDLPEVTLARVPVNSQLAISGYGTTVYEATDASGPMKFFANGRPEVGFVQSSSIEIPNRAGVAAELEHETTIATQTYKIFKDMLDNFNKTVDDSIGLVK